VAGDGPDAVNPGLLVMRLDLDRDVREARRPS
jgi:hypothetical protein